METETLSLAGEVDFSLMALFLRATLVVKLVMLLLILASVWSWGVVIAKHIAFRRTRQAADGFLKAFWSGEPLDSLFERIGSRPRHAAEGIFVSGMKEWRRSYQSDGEVVPGSQERIARAMELAVRREEEVLSSGLGVLASIGSISPFVGLFGTVWGIKNAFEEIAMQQSTNLAVVAPGIAEALVATALGLFAAIPAVIFYNKLSGDADRIASLYQDFSGEFALILSRQIDRGGQ